MLLDFRAYLFSIAAVYLYTNSSLSLSLALPRCSLPKCHPTASHKPNKQMGNSNPFLENPSRLTSSRARQLKFVSNHNYLCFLGIEKPLYTVRGMYIRVLRLKTRLIHTRSCLKRNKHSKCRRRQNMATFCSFDAFMPRQKSRRRSYYLDRESLYAYLRAF